MGDRKFEINSRGSVRVVSSLPVSLPTPFYTLQAVCCLILFGVRRPRCGESSLDVLALCTPEFPFLESIVLLCTCMCTSLELVLRNFQMLSCYDFMSSQLKLDFPFSCGVLSLQQLS